jgi:hypothetical protein
MKREASFQGSLSTMPEENDKRSPVALEQRGVSADQRMFSPSAIVDREPGNQPDPDDFRDLRYVPG